MGKRKQRVRWCVVDGLKWSNNEDESSPEGSVSGKVTGSYPAGTGSSNGPGSYNVGPHRRSSQSWIHNGVAPRFERRSQAGNRQVYYDGEYCDAEEMPNGFTKIRSKNLDILFKREYYEQKLCQPRPKDYEHPATKETAADEEVTATEQLDPRGEVAPDVQPTSADFKSFKSSKSLDQIDPSEIREFRPMNSVTETDSEQLNSGEQSPYYPPYYDQQQQQSGGGYNYSPAPPRPNLYLYSPSNNTLIPCEEIVIPNPVMGSEGPVYPGPTNIYLAYPVSGPDGRGYITQPFSPPLPTDYVSYPSYSPSISLDGSQYQSSTPQTPNSGQDSGSSTQPTSPPPLVNFHPANWFQPAEPEVSKETGEHIGKERRNSVNRNETPTVQYIPGLPLDSTPKKSQKKKKKKKPVSGAGGQRDSVSSESELCRIYGSMEDTYSASQVVEVNLTDSLADCMVNPPTDPECSDEETLQNTSENNPGVVTVEEAGTGGLPRDDTISNLEELAAEEPEQGASIPETDSLGSENLIDSGIEKDLEEILTSEPDNKKDNQSSSESVESFDINPPETSVEPCQNALADEPAINAETTEAEAPINIPTETTSLEVKENVMEHEARIGAHLEDAPSNLDLPDGEDSATVTVDQPEPCSTQQQDPVLPKSKKKKNKKKKVDKEVDAPEAEPAAPTVAATPTAAAAPVQTSTPTHTPAGAQVHTSAPAEIEENIPTEPEPPKLSYSAICRTRDQQQQQPPIAKPAARDPPSSQTKSEASPAPPRPESVPALHHLKDEEWETVPASITSKPGEWEKKKDRKRKKKRTTVNFQDAPEVVEIHEPAGAEEEQRESSVPPLETVRIPSPNLKERTPTPDKEQQQEEEEEEELEVEEKKSKKKRKKKYGSEEPEDKGHRVLICDNQIEIRFSRSVRRASEVLGEEQINAVRSSGYCDILLIEKLGCGMTRGSMHLGRLYQGRYVPPDRVDGLLPIKEETQEGCEEQKPCVPEEPAPTVAEEIDLD